MGLDITAYRQLKEERKAFGDDDGYPEKLTRLWNNKDFPNSFEGLKEKTLYSYADSHGFRAGSYGGYNAWREWLAALVGYKETEYVASFGGLQKARAAACWEGETGPFSELINFSDCDGTIGPKAADKLAKDFAEWDERAKAADRADGYNYSRYKEWRKACEMAADGGAIAFH